MIKIKDKFKRMFTPMIAKPIFYKSFYKFVLAMVPILLWDRFVNVKKYYSILDTGFFIAGVFYLMLAWMNYLKLDGMKVYGLDIFKVIFHSGDKNSKQKKTGSMMDFVQQDIPDYDELSEKDKTLTKFGANLFTGLVLTAVSLIYIAIKF